MGMGGQLWDRESALQEVAKEGLGDDYGKDNRLAPSQTSIRPVVFRNTSSNAFLFVLAIVCGPAVQASL